MIAIGGYRDLHEHYPAPPLPGTLRGIGAAAWLALKGFTLDELHIASSPVGVHRIAVLVTYREPRRFAWRAARRLRDRVRLAVQVAVEPNRPPGVSIEVEVRTHRRAGAAA